MITTRRHTAFLVGALLAGGALGWIGALHVAQERFASAFKFTALTQHLHQQNLTIRDHQRAQDAFGLRELLRVEGPEVLERELSDRIEMHELGSGYQRTLSDEHRERVEAARAELTGWLVERMAAD